MIITIEPDSNGMHASIVHKGHVVEIRYAKKDAAITAYLATILAKAIMAEDYIENPDVSIVL